MWYFNINSRKHKVYYRVCGERGFFEAYKQLYRVKIQEVVFKKSVCSSTDVSKSDFSKQSFISESKQKKKKNPKLCTKLR